MHAYRTHTCGALRVADTGRTVRLSGWVHRKRDHGQLLFIDLRDHYGITQCVIDISSPLFRVADALRLESVVASIRRRMIEQGFNEFQTPILTADSPEGARPYYVPSRLHPGEFYALPQAPQQFKQLLMVAGFDRYFQIAPCFRDEASRADRAPGEFYQLDLEMSFVTQEDVFAAVEPVL